MGGPLSLSRPEITVVVPVFQNSRTLPEIYKRLVITLDSYSLPYEVLFVDDACPEGSIEVLKNLAEKDQKVGVIALERNVGQHRAAMTGLRYALGKWVAILDADLQDPPEAIPLLLDRLRAGYAAVFAGRRGLYESPFRLLTSRLFKLALHLVAGVPRDAGIYMVMTRQMVDRLLAFPESRPFLLALMGCTGLPLSSIPVERAKRPIGTSAYTFWQRVRVGFAALSWAICWKLFARRLEIGHIDKEIVVQAFIGDRFIPAHKEYSEA